MTNLDELYDIDARAQAIAAYSDGVLVCLAGPGTGKTFSFLERIKALYAQQGGTAKGICYLTFIKEITRAFADDYQEKVGATEKPRISTLHSFACRLLRNRGFQEGYDGPLYFTSVAEPEDYRSTVFLNDLLPLVKMGELRTVPRLRKLFADRIKPAWRNNLDVEALDEPVPAVLPMYFALSRAYRLIDWDHTVPFARKLLKGLPVLPEWISQIQHFLIDEYQDFNQAEQSFLAALAASARSMIIVGDDDQSLYSTRGGSPDGLKGLYGSKDTDQISLVRCHRCKPGILDKANAFLATMRPDPRSMIPKDGAKGGRVECLSFKSRKAEVEYLTGCLKNRLGKLPEKPRPEDGIVCLFPTKDALRSYMEILVEGGVPCYSRQPAENQDRAWLELVLRLVSQPGQRFLERLLLEGFNDIKPLHKQAMVELILDQDISPSEAMSILLSDNKLTGVAASAAQQFCNLCQALSSQDPDLIAAQLAQRIPGEAGKLSAQIAFLIQQFDEAEPEETIETLCDTLLPETAPPPEDLRAVLFTTMHGSKGLTKKTVAMPGLEDAWLPGGAEGDSLAEKRRLFYVALTRATDEVLITYPRTRPRKDPLNYPCNGRGEACRFVTDSGIPVAYRKD